MLINSIKLLVVSCLTIGYLVNAYDEKQLGYYAFEKSGKNELPPRIRPPPYLQTFIQCSNRYLENKDTLCGDLSRGSIPINPMGILINGENYPFELIKNKTLHFLAKSLPFLKEDHENIPIVFKVSQAGNELYSNLDTINQPLVNRVKRQAKATVTKIDKSELNVNETYSSNNSTNLSAKNYRTVDEPTQESKQKGCGPNDGMLCHIVQALASKQNLKSSESSGSFLNTVSNYYNAYKTAQNLGNFISSLDKSDNTNEKTSNDQFSYSQMLSTITQMLNGANNQQTTTPPSNPLNHLLDYFNNLNNGGNSGISLLGRRKKNPVDMDDYGLTAASSIQSSTIAKTDEQVSVGQLTPTPCPSIEEYVTPVYARNHQGIWKYIVQVPHEGYFTQTIQKTSCVKNKCDYMDGTCKEANRWVSLLVAEVYYPNAKKPLNNMLPQQSQLKPIYNSFNTMQNLNPKLNGQPSYGDVDANAINFELFNSLIPQTTNFNDFNHYDQFARRASKNHQPVSTATQKPSASLGFGFPTATYSMPQYQELNSNNQYSELNLNNLNNQNNQYQTYQPNYNQVNQLNNQVVNNQQHNTAKSNQPYNINQLQQAKSFEQLIDLYNQQYFKQQQYTPQISKSKANNAAYNLIDSLTSSASMMYPATVVSQSSGQTSLNQPMIQPIQAQNLQQFNGKLMNDPMKQQNEIKPRSFDTSYLNNNEDMSTAPTNDKVILNEQNTNQPTNVDLNNNNNLNNQPQSNQNEQNDNSRENTNNNNEECDGYDSNGCYLIRVYYDWFIVSGSCKCWKVRPNAKGGSIEAIKKFFIGGK